MSVQKETIRAKTRRKMLSMYILRGCRSLVKRRNRIFFLGVLIFLVVIFKLISIFLSPIDDLTPFISALYGFSSVVTLSIIAVGILLFFGAPRDCFAMSEDLIRIGFVNSAGECPVLVDNCKSEDDNVRLLCFENRGIPLSVWIDNTEKIGAALNVHIINHEYGRNNREIKLTVISADHQLPSKLIWSISNLCSSDFEINLGESVIGKVTVNLNVIPHILIGGSTGSGKTILLRSILLQCIAKQAELVIADFKGVDFHHIWSSYSEIITDPNTFSESLNDIILELLRRKKLFAATDVSDIREYNATKGDLQHIVVACDEISELLDKTGTSKEEKEKISRIEGYLSTIARQGRAFGIHLVLATQRPDANILPGQIKNNIDCRICGRADNVLSMIILDNTDASDLIPKNQAGRFIMNNGTVFQGFYVDDYMLSDLDIYTKIPSPKYEQGTV